MNEMRKFYPLTEPAFTYSVVCGKRQVKVYFSFKKNVNKQHRHSPFCVLKFVSHGLASIFVVQNVAGFQILFSAHRWSR